LQVEFRASRNDILLGNTARLDVFSGQMEKVDFGADFQDIDRVDVIFLVAGLPGTFHKKQRLAGTACCSPVTGTVTTSNGA
jgi:hypothetical protein